jgi:hypothetical protein
MRKEAVAANFRYYPGIFLKGLKKPTKILCEDGRDLNPGPPEYEAKALTTRPRCSVSLFLYNKLRWQNAMGILTHSTLGKLTASVLSSIIGLAHSEGHLK